MILKIEDILPEGWQLVELYDSRDFDNDELSYTASIMKSQFVGMISVQASTATEALVAASNVAREYELKHLKVVE